MSESNTSPREQWVWEQRQRLLELPEADQRLILQMLREAMSFADRQREERVADVEQKYMELIYAVGMKHEGETRHETALRYIREREKPNDQAVSQSGPLRQPKE